MAESKGLSLRFVMSHRNLVGDAVLFSRILRNLIANAIRYTPKGKVLVGARLHNDGRLRVEVWDSGVGIEASGQTPFSTEPMQISSGDHGRGLGLAIVTRLASLLEHQIQVRSTPGKGTMFAIFCKIADQEPDPSDILRL
ncbi:MAG TPA: ATP-binding protein [Rhodospirillaceae bacterium]|nr:ATP-binding protein [Rhodospirillaceae bacterium]